MLPRSRIARLAAPCLWASLASLAFFRTPAPAAAPHRSIPPAVEAKLGKPLLRYDRPDEAQELYRLKRAPLGRTAIPVERYLAALERMERMPQHSTVRGMVLPSRAQMAGRGISYVADAGSLGAWTALGPGNVGGRTRALLFDPRTPETLYAAGVAGGVWKSTDGGASWRPLSDLIANLAVNSLAMDPRNPNVLYAGTGEGYFNVDAVRGAGIFKTTDGGATWTRLAATANASFHYVNDLAISARRSARIYAATSTGVWRSLDRGATWRRVLATEVTGGCLDLALRTDQAGDVLFASCGSFEQATVYRNTAAHANGSWTAVLRERGMGRTSLAIAPSNQNVIYALASSIQRGTYENGFLAVFRSTSGGSAGSWTARARNTSPRKLDTLLLSNPVLAMLPECGFGNERSFFNQGWYDNVIAVDPRDPNRVWAGGVDLFRSDDGGRSWGLASYWWAQSRQGTAPSYAHADQHAIVFHPRYDGTSERTMLVGNDGGIFRTRDARAATARGATAPCSPGNTPFAWESLNNGYAVTQFYHGVAAPDGASYFGGAQDNGTVRGTDAEGPDRWTEILGGDGGYVAMDPDDPDVLYAETTRLSLRKSTDGGDTFEAAVEGIDEEEDFLFITPFVMDPSDADRLWLGGTSLWRTDNGAASWIQASAPVAGVERRLISAIAVSPADPNRVLMGTVEGFIHRSDSALTSTGATAWRRTRPAAGYVSWLAFDPADPDVAYATYSTFGVVHVWRTADGGATWTPLGGTGEGRLPDVPAHAIVADPENPSHLYVSTDLGVFSSLDGGLTWMVENTGFANVATEALSVRVTPGGERYLFAFTHGRGAWRVRLGG